MDLDSEEEHSETDLSDAGSLTSSVNPVGTQATNDSDGRRSERVPGSTGARDEGASKARSKASNGATSCGPCQFLRKGTGTSKLGPQKAQAFPCTALSQDDGLCPRWEGLFRIKDTYRQVKTTGYYRLPSEVKDVVRNYVTTREANDSQFEFKWDVNNFPDGKEPEARRNKPRGKRPSTANTATAKASV
jgi:hypothetical protein